MSTIPATFDKEQTRFDKNPHDLFETPMPLVTACLSKMAHWQPKTVLDVGCGYGAWGRGARAAWPEARIVGVDIVPRLPVEHTYNNFYRNDFLDVDPGTFDFVIGNPPYSAKGNRNLAADLVMHGLDCLAEDGRLGFLLKTEFVNADNRYNSLFRINPPIEHWVVVQRPSFYGNGRSNTICYSFFIWKRSNPQLCTQTRWLSWR